MRIFKKGHFPTFDESIKETTTVCPHCSVGCSIIVSTRNGKVVNTEGDPDSPINRGSLCTKGGSIYQMAVNKNRLGKPLYRAPYATEWKEVTWEWALDWIAENVKKSRDKNFKFKNDKGLVVNRTEGIHALGFVVIFAFFFVHLYLGTIGSPGSLPAMLHGWVTRSWLKKQHAKWLREMEEAGMLEVYGEEKKTAHGH